MYKIAGEKPSFSKKLSDQTIRDYDDVSLKVRCDGTPKPSLKWYKDGKEITEDERIKITTTTEGQIDSELNITHFGVSDVGKVKFSITIGMSNLASNLSNYKKLF